MNADAAHVPDAFAAWTTPDADALDRRSLAEWIDGLDVSPLGTLAIDAQMTSDNGVRSAWQSYLGNLAMIKGGGLEKYWTETERFHCAGGNQQLAERLAAAIGRERVRLREPVTAVPVEGSRVTVATAARSYEAEYAVLAVPPLTWNGIAFTPALHVTSTPQMGTNVKYLVGLNAMPWSHPPLSPAMLTDGPVNVTWWATEGQHIAGAGMVAFSGGAVGGHLPFLDRRRAGRELHARTGRDLPFAAVRHREAPVHELAVGSPAQGLIFVSCTDRSHAHRPATAAAARRPRIPCRGAHLLRVRGLYGRRAAVRRAGRAADRGRGKSFQLPVSSRQGVRSGKSFQLPVSSRQLSRKPIFLDSWNLNAGGWKLAAIGAPSP
jgi:hypothetical protein